MIVDASLGSALAALIIGIILVVIARMVTIERVVNQILYVVGIIIVLIGIILLVLFFLGVVI